MARICGVSKISPREGADMRCIDVREEDVAALKEALGLDGDIEPGLYQVIEETTEAYRPIDAATTAGTASHGEVSNGMMR